MISVTEILFLGGLGRLSNFLLKHLDSTEYYF